MAITPRNVQVEDDAVVIEWSDGHSSRYDHRYLRIECACAGCIEELTGRRILDVLSIPADVAVLDHLAVGRYALQFLFSDGHSTGIYPYRLLRRLCRCGDDHSTEE